MSGTHTARHLRRALWAALLPVLGVLLLPTPVGAITLGAGPALTNRLGEAADQRGTVWYEEFQDWNHGDVRALDPNADALSLGDGHDTARDLIAFYARLDGESLFLRVDLFDLLFGSEASYLNLYVAIDCAPGGTTEFPDGLETFTDPAHPWELCVALYDSMNHSVYSSLATSVSTGWRGAYFHADLDAVEFGIARQLLVDAGWDGTSTLHFQVITAKDFHETANESDAFDAVGALTRNVGGGYGRAETSIASDASTGRAKYAVIAHANQSVGTRSATRGHILTRRPDLDLYPGFIRLLDSAEMLNTPINLHISGTLLISFLWAEQNPADSDYPDRDGPAFVDRVRLFVTDGPGSLVGGVLAEHIMPYFEGAVNAASLRQNSDLLEHLFGLTEEEMKVMHVPERVIRSNTNSVHTRADGPLDGKTFEEIEQSGYTATYLDEVTHLHWWFYPNEQSNPGWDDFNCGRWAGGQGNDEELYHHKIHKINGVYCFMINDREDQSKFGNTGGGMALDTRYTLLDKALQADGAQVTLVFDDWEAFAGNSFASADPNNNADQFHHTLRWAANHPWIEIVNLVDLVGRVAGEPGWVIDHDYVFNKTSQTYEWLKRASEHHYDNWYYGSAQEENFFSRVPPVYWDGTPVTPAGMKPYGDMNTPNTLIRDAWDAIQQASSPNLKDLAEWSFNALIYETAWHDEDANPDQYKSRNYQDIAQGGFNRGVAQGNCDESVSDTTFDNTAGWALRLHGHVRDVGVMKDASDWVADIRNGSQGPQTRVAARDVDDDTLDEYILCNNRVYLCFERWGARLIKAFVYDPAYHGGDARAVVGVPVANPAYEHEKEDADLNRCSAFKDRYSYGFGDNRYVDLDFADAAAPPVSGPDSWTFLSKDGLLQKTISLWDGRDVALAAYEAAPAAGNLETRFGLGPGQMDIVFNGPEHLVRRSDPSYRGLANTQGGEAYVVLGRNVTFHDAPVNTGWDRRELPLVEQFETVSAGSSFSVALAFSEASAADLDGDGLSNTNEWALGTRHDKADTDDDGMPDGYEVVEGLLPGVDDAGSDRDGDGVPNGEEYVADTHAGDSNSFFLATGLLVGSPAHVIFPASTARVYTLQYDDPRSTGTWRSVAGQEGIAFPTGGPQALVDGSETNARLYRVEVDLP